MGAFAMTRMGVDLFPKVEIPVVVVTVPYLGAMPEEIETLITKPLEDEFSSISGLDKIKSYSREGVSIVVIFFYLEADIKDAEQQVRNKLSAIRRSLPSDIQEPNIDRIAFDAAPVVRLAVSADLGEAEIYRLATKQIKPMLEQANNVGAVRILGGREREIQIELDRNLLNSNELTALGISQQLKNYGENTPLGKYETGGTETSFRTIGRFTSLEELKDVVVSFGGDYSSYVPLKRVSNIYDGLEDAESFVHLYAPKHDEDLDFEKPNIIETIFNIRKNDKTNIEREYKPALFIDVIKQSGSNTISVANDIKKRIENLNERFEDMPGKPKLVIISDQSHFIKADVEDVVFAIIVGIFLAVVVVYFFLGNIRSTIITGLALPNSLLGAFIIMYAVGFTANVMSLLALSLAVGLLIDDSIVVRENIFKRMEAGEHPVRAAETGTMQVIMAVLATSLVIIVVFLPIGLIQGMIGQFFKEFAFTVVFALIISTFDAMTMAPMLSAYFAGNINQKPNFLIRGFNKFQDWVDMLYHKTLKIAIARPALIILLTGVVLAGSFVSLKFIKFTFMPVTDRSEFVVSINMPAGTSLEGTAKFTQKIEERLFKIPELHMLASVVGSQRGTVNPIKSDITVILKPYYNRTRNSIDIKEELQETFREQFADYDIIVSDFDMLGGGGTMAPYTLYLTGNDLSKVEEYANELLPYLQAIPDLSDVRVENEAGKPEFQIALDPKKMQQVAVAPLTAGMELRLQIAGNIVAKLYEDGEEYDVRLRLKPEQRNLQSAYYNTFVPNIHNKLIPLSILGEGQTKESPSMIAREFRSRIIPITANLSRGGAIGAASDLTKDIMKDKLPLPEGVSYIMGGQSEDLDDLVEGILIALTLALIFIYLALSSLYGSFITPFTILMALPPAVAGALYALAITGKTLDVFSMIGIVMLLGLVAKNSILLVDFAMQEIREGIDRKTAIYNAGVARLRPILMTSVAMIGGMLPVAIGIGEAAKARVSLGIAIIGGLILSTLVSLVVVPSIFSAIDRFRVWIENFFTPEYDFREVGKAWRPEQDALQAELEKQLPQLKNELHDQLQKEIIETGEKNKQELHAEFDEKFAAKPKKSKPSKDNNINKENNDSQKKES